MFYFEIHLDRPWIKMICKHFEFGPFSCDTMTNFRCLELYPNTPTTKVSSTKKLGDNNTKNDLDFDRPIL